MALRQRERDKYVHVSEGNQPLGTKAPVGDCMGWRARQRWDSHAQNPPVRIPPSEVGSQGDRPSVSHCEPGYSSTAPVVHAATRGRSRCNVVERVDGMETSNGQGSACSEWRPDHQTLEGGRREAKWKRSSRVEANQQATDPDATQCPAGGLLGDGSSPARTTLLSMDASHDPSSALRPPRLSHGSGCFDSTRH